MRVQVLSVAFGMAFSFMPQTAFPSTNGLNAADDVDGCWRDAFSRGLGEMPSVCKDTEELYEPGLCLPKCQDGYEPNGLFCENPHDVLDRYSRGTPTIADCSNETERNLGRCYTPCQTGYEGVGPLCFSFTCPKALHFPCGPVCVPSLDKCTKDVFDLSLKGYQSLFKFITLHPMDGLDRWKYIAKRLLSWPLCRRVFDDENSGFSTMEDAPWVWENGRVVPRR